MGYCLLIHTIVTTYLMLHIIIISSSSRNCGQGDSMGAFYVVIGVVTDKWYIVWVTIFKKFVFQLYTVDK